MRRLFLTLSLPILFVTGCATTEYVDRKGSFWGSGFYDSKVQEGVYKVGYTGNGSTRADHAEDFAILRCAELASQNGYKYFIVVDKGSRTNVNSTYTPLMPYTYKGSTFYTGGYSTDTYSPDIEYLINCFELRPIGEKRIVYSAEEVKANMRQKYNLDGTVTNSKKDTAVSPGVKTRPSDSGAPAPAESSLGTTAPSPQDNKAVSQAFDKAFAG